MTGISEKVLQILNEPGMTWKVRRALLRGYGLSEELIRQFVPAECEKDAY